MDLKMKRLENLEFHLVEYWVGIKLVHKSGGIQCCTGCSLSSFGCSGSKNQVGTFITTEKKSEWIMPPLETPLLFGLYDLPGFDYLSNEIIIKDYNQSVQEGQILKIWYGQDLVNVSEENNSGIHCVDVYAMFCDV